MKFDRNLFSILFLLVSLLLAGCAGDAPRPPAPGDWTTEYLGKGRVRAAVTNASHHALFLKIRNPAETAAQVKLDEDGTRTVFLAPGSYVTVMKITANGEDSYFKGPALDVPAGVASIALRLELSETSNLKRITREEFER
jgi:hypothetical protein